MAVYEIFSHAELRRYKAHIASKATIVQIICALLTFIPPLLIAYRSEGFWLKTSTYREQPEVHYKHQVLAVFDTAQGADYLVYSTFSNFNQLQATHFRSAILKSREEDNNQDGRNDLLNFQLEIPLSDQEAIYGVTLILLFDYQLHKYASLQMEAMAFIQERSPLAAASFDFIGDLRLQQREPLSHKGTDRRFNVPVIDKSSIHAHSYRLQTILKDYALRNFSTQLETMYPAWELGAVSGRPFTIKGTVLYPTEQILYSPGFWQLLKAGWIQYLSILIIFIYIFRRVKIFVFQNQLVTTIVHRPWKVNT